MAVINDLLIRFENEKVRVLIKLDDGSFDDAPDTIVLNVEEGDRVRWSFVGLRLQILFGTNVPQANSVSSSLAPAPEDLISENTPFATDTFIAEGNSTDFNQNGAIFPDLIEPLQGTTSFTNGQEVWEEDTFKYTINLTDVDGVLHTLDPNISRRRLRRTRTE